jgi:hypothetical protein
MREVVVVGGEVGGGREPWRRPKAARRLGFGEDRLLWESAIIILIIACLFTYDYI